MKRSKLERIEKYALDYLRTRRGTKEDWAEISKDFINPYFNGKILSVKEKNLISETIENYYINQ